VLPSFFFLSFFDEWKKKQISQEAVKIRGMADRAQADLGMDYAWLEDVSYHDWQRYHDLVRG
jgi:hypothetical protein